MVGALRFVDEGRLDLDTDVNRYLRAWRLPGDTTITTITTRMLLGHTAGLTYCWYRGFGRGEPLPTRLDVLEDGGSRRRFRRAPHPRPPGGARARGTRRGVRSRRSPSHPRAPFRD